MDIMWRLKYYFVEFRTKNRVRENFSSCIPLDANIFLGVLTDRARVQNFASTTPLVQNMFLGVRSHRARERILTPSTPWVQKYVNRILSIIFFPISI